MEGRRQDRCPEGRAAPLPAVSAPLGIARAPAPAQAGRLEKKQSAFCPRGSGAEGETMPQPPLDNATGPTRATAHRAPAGETGGQCPSGVAECRGASRSAGNLQLRRPAKRASLGRASTRTCAHAREPKPLNSANSGGHPHTTQCTLSPTLKVAVTPCKPCSDHAGYGLRGGVRGRMGREGRGRRKTLPL